MSKKNQLSQETIAQYREVFTLFDKDGDGLITPKELAVFLKAFGLDPTETEMLSLIKRVEIERNGVIDFDEFLSLMTTTSEADGDDGEEEELREAFRVFDKDGDGFLSLVELEDLFTNLNEKLTEQEFKKALKLIDIDGDGRVDYSEFKQFVVASK